MTEKLVKHDPSLVQSNDCFSRVCPLCSCLLSLLGQLLVVLLQVLYRAAKIINLPLLVIDLLMQLTDLHCLVLAFRLQCLVLILKLFDFLRCLSKFIQCRHVELSSLFFLSNCHLECRLEFTVHVLL